MTDSFRVTAQWDAEAGVWVATSEDIVGLVTEAATLDDLYRRVVAVTPELLADNDVTGPDPRTIDFHVLADITGDAAE
ncbi:DUF1902 domain-containing protein [Devosia albogilva]|uniref:DUF1902 domain-containing protein n=1 Tax=Devosia albogilva TaxID=429726 RepID=A0ABW5QL87_9HYPH